jgi:hypothetical protein
VDQHRLGDLAADAHERVERGHRLLEDHRHVRAAELRGLRLAEPDDVAVVAADGDPAGRRERVGQEAHDGE